jgi:S-sulfo-L-cysteine synthase (3-phospho-L-serine-dependent)
MTWLFVESNTTGTGRLAVERVIARGHRLVFLTGNPSRYPFLIAPPPSVDVVRLDTNDPDALTFWASGLRAGHGIEAVLTFSTFYVDAAARLAAMLRCRGLNADAARRCHDKYAARVALREAGLRTPAFWLVDSESSARACASAARYPCVVKPRSASGSRGVRLVDGPDDLLRHYRAIAEVRVNEREQVQPGDALVEDMLDGPELSVETITFARGDTRIVGITAKHLSAPPLFVEMGHDFPADLPGATRCAIEQTTIDALAAVDYDFGPAHTELRLTAAGPVIVEINPRLAGGMIPEVIREATGIDLIEAVLDASADRPVLLDARRSGVGAIRFVTAPRPGRLCSTSTLADSIDRARATPLVRQVAIERAAGAVVRPAECATDRIGYVIAAGGDRRTVLAAAEDTRRQLTLDIVGTAKITASATGAHGGG